MRRGGVDDDFSVSHYRQASFDDLPTDRESPPSWIAIAKYSVVFPLGLFRRQEPLGVKVVPCASVDGRLYVVSDGGR